MKSAKNFREFVSTNSVELKRDANNKIGVQTKTVHSDYTGKDETYHIMSGIDGDGNALLFIPSLKAWDDKAHLGDTEVVAGGMAKDGRTPVFFLHKPASFAETFDDSDLGL